ncbi:MAG: sensor domain-containing diguanylate cyclase [Clostridium sp.]|uniref:sensor domain-containing diguanylate cyclase n=1 Tax=Clostridium sp. TaxID=1506 RepID=UPI003F31EDF8
MDYYKKLYESEKCNHEKYKEEMRAERKNLEEKNAKLLKDIDVLANIIQISQYINSYIRDKNLVNMINDMIVGVLGVKHSSIYVRESDGKLVRNVNEVCNIEPTEEEQKNINEGTEYLFISDDYIKICPKCKAKIKSSMGMPIKLRGKFIGYIAVDHTIDLTEENRIFLSSISAQIAIALENSLLYRELSDIAKKDSLMGIYNRKYFFKRAEEILGKDKEKYAIVMLDLDNFKKVNDNFGHQYGDEVLKRVSKIISKNLLKESVFARYGGEELIILIYNYKEKLDVIESLENIRTLIEKETICLGEIKSKVTTSIGISFSKEKNGKIAEVISRADALLYDAKHNGKNRIEYETI